MGEPAFRAQGLALAMLDALLTSKGMLKRGS